jgi:predicted peroxiredoxin
VNKIFCQLLLIFLYTLLIFKKEVGKMSKLLFYLLVDSDNPTKACFPFLQALANKKMGNDVKIALDGDAVALMSENTINTVIPRVCPPLKKMLAMVIENGIPIYV